MDGTEQQQINNSYINKNVVCYGLLWYSIELHVTIIRKVHHGITELIRIVFHNGINGINIGLY